MKNQFQQLFLRIAISVTMLSAVADRFGLWGDNSSWGNWKNFEVYTLKLTYFLPEILSIFSAYIATFLEILFPVMLILGYKTRIASYGSGILLLVFAVSMAVALGAKAPLDYSVWIGSAGAFLLAVQQEYSYSIDFMFQKK
ncbi:DoxX family membrane protein [Elizabethkingia anophelis]|uniref:DoxX family membrane protein n=1 Tax=Elizabethkingia anophelis TaxID=1117645 RepID=UPI00077E9692|nr:DoxX family membrane protein [Elizabethkingia anophelis]AMR43148.1 DoxX family protein [Elizabethkingia anophelis]AMX49789.1 DoxX family protein [Elizabethkingia anophelis]AMX53177.1 DoxX family protein [Elizabethkingia anophelis]AMX56640.1 DoxX family protein [Elizabethkingia anophelis]EJG2050188.1 DoxX family membrane protein [Elizabethkingia anophelis]